jgi:hypothetical protein
MTQERLSPGEPDLFHAERNKKTGKSGNFLKSKNFVPVYPLVLVERHAIAATKVAPVGDRDPEIFYRTAKRIF